MRLLARLVGFLFLFATLAVLAFDLWAWAYVGGFDGEPSLRLLGKVWFDLHAGSLNLVQAVIERYLWPPLWDPGILWLLRMPAAPVLAVFTLLFFWLGTRRRKR